MATYNYTGYAADDFIIEGGGSNVTVGSQFMLDPNWSASTHGVTYSITDDDATFSGDADNNYVGDDPDQTGSITYPDATSSSGRIFIGEKVTAIDGAGNTVTFYTVYVGSTYVGAVSTGPVQPGRTYEVTAIDNVTSADAPAYTSIYSATYEQGTANSMQGGAYNDTLYGGAGSDTIDVGSGTGNAAEGGSGNDTIYGSTNADTLKGDSGADSIWADSGDDLIYGGTDNDTLGGDAGNDTIYGEGGWDLIYGGSGADYIDGGSEGDSIEGGLDNDTIYGGTGSDTIWGDEGADSIHGGDDGDLIYGNDGNDTIWGDGGNDTIYVGAGSNEAHGGDGADLIDDTSGVRELGPNLMYGDAGNDTIYSGDGNDTVYGGADNDWITGEGGDDTIYGDSGADIINGDAGNDYIEGGTGDDQLLGGSGNDTILFGEGNDSVWGNDGDDSIDDWAGVSTMPYTNYVEGGAGNDTVFTGEGSDTISGGTGNDWLDGEGGNDSISGDDGADTIKGNSGNDYIDGGLGDDSLSGGKGNDTIYFGEGLDTIDGGTGDDLIDDVSGDAAYAYNTSIDAGGGNDTVRAGGGSDTILGGSGSDLIEGEAGDDTIDAGSDHDTIVGGAGADLITTGVGRDVVRVIDGAGADTVTDFNMADLNSDGLTDDQIDVSLLQDGTGGAVTWEDVMVTDDGLGNALLTFPNGESLLLQGVAPTQVDSKFELHSVGIPCYADGTFILTPGGEVPVESLKAGDRVVTLHHGIQPILWAGSRVVTQGELDLRPDLAPIRLRKGLLGNHRDLLVSPQHAMLLPDKGGGQSLVRATHLDKFGDGRVRQAAGKRGVSYHHLLLPMHAVVFANGAPGETLYPGAFALGGFERAAKAELFSLFPALGRVLSGDNAAKIYGPMALPMASPRSLRRQVQVLPDRGDPRRWIARLG